MGTTLEKGWRLPMKRIQMSTARWHCLRAPPCSCLGDHPDRDEGALSLSTCPRGGALTVEPVSGGPVGWPTRNPDDAKTNGARLWSSSIVAVFYASDFPVLFFASASGVAMECMFRTCLGRMCVCVCDMARPWLGLGLGLNLRLGLCLGLGQDPGWA